MAKSHCIALLSLFSFTLAVPPMPVAKFLIPGPLHTTPGFAGVSRLTGGVPIEGGSPVLLRQPAQAGLDIYEEVPSGAYSINLDPPRDVYAIAEIDSSQLSLWDSLPSPVTALAAVASCALSTVEWVLSNSGLILLGGALVIGFCALTPFCTLIIEKPLASKLRSVNAYVHPYLDNVEYYVKTAYNKYQGIQDCD